MPGTYVYSIENEGWTSGLAVENEVIVDTTLYDYRFVHGGIYPLRLAPYSMIYSDNTYQFSFKMVCNTLGRYVMLTGDNSDSDAIGAVGETDPP